MMWLLNKRLRDLEEQQHQSQQVIIEMRRQQALAREDQMTRQREGQMMRNLYEQLMKELDSKNKEFEMKLETQDSRGKELESLVRKVQKLEHEELNRIKRVLHEKVVSDREKAERNEEKARVLFQELARLGEDFRENGKEEAEERRDLVRRMAQVEGRMGEEGKR